MDFRNFFGNKTSPSPADTMELTKLDLLVLKISGVGSFPNGHLVEFHIEGYNENVSRELVEKSVRNRLQTDDDAWKIGKIKQGREDRWYIRITTESQSAYDKWYDTFERGIPIETYCDLRINFNE